MGTLERARAGRQVFPGAHLTEVVGDDHHGVVNVRLGVLAPASPVRPGSNTTSTGTGSS